MQRKIIHIDCDCFYAAVEMRDDPSLRNRPIAVGGDPGKRGVISTCNYEARQYGVRSAMASAYAKRLCPQLIILPHRISYYKEVSQQIMRILRQYTDRIEPLSLDEAFLDVTGQPHFQGSATLMAEAIRKQVRSQVGITVSAGVAPNKFLAKIASEWNKPDGLFVLRPEQVDDFVAQLPVEKLHGVGKVTAERLHRIGIRTCADIRAHDHFQFVEKVGSFGEYLYRLAHGHDERPVETRDDRKSLSVEHTYAQDLPDLDSCLRQIPDLQDRLEQRLRRSQQDQVIKKAFVKIKFADFTSTTMECCVREPSLPVYKSLCDEAFQRKGMSVRLLGVGVRFAERNHASVRQYAFEFA
ncbi:MAG: DNA polymerase IV [Gammaproteobacteria bacterium]